VVWQCRRTTSYCEDLKARGVGELLRARTGLQIDPMFSGSKLHWLLAALPDGFARAAAGELCAGTMDAWLLWKMTGGTVHATDLTNASRTQLLNLHTLDWDDEILGIFGIPRAMLPALQPSSTVFGTTQPHVLPQGGVLHGGLPIGSLIGDSHASLYGLGGFRPGTIKATYGTGTSLMAPTPELTLSNYGLSSTIAWAREDRRHAVFALEGNIYTTGGAVEWIGQLLGLADPGPEVEALARTVPDAGGVTFVPALVGLGAPHWAPAARGVVAGLSLSSGRAHLARAALDAIAYQVRDGFEAMQADAEAPRSMLLADGGASRNDLLMQLQADALGIPVERSRSGDVSPLGAALLAGLATSVWAGEEELLPLIPARDRFEPQIGGKERAMSYSAWQEALARTLYRS
jgi:glycerol kinase